MKLNVKHCAISLVCGFTLSASLLQAVQAHGIYVAQRQSNTAFIYGHGSSDETFIADKFKGAVAHDDGKTTELAIEYKNGYPTLPDDESLGLVTAAFDNGFWSQKTDGEWENKPKTEVENAKQGGHYMKYTTTILNPEVKAGQVTGMPLEIVPLTNPLTLKQGDTFPIQVYADGQPAVGVKVVSEFVTDPEQNIVETDSEGKAEIIIRNSGLNVLATETSKELEDKTKADKLAKFATLSFTFSADH